MDFNYNIDLVDGKLYEYNMMQTRDMTVFKRIRTQIWYGC